MGPALKWLLVTLVCTASLASSVREYAEVSELSEAEEAGGAWERKLPTVAGGATASYYKVPFFVLKAGSTKIRKAKTSADCEQACSQRKTCKSFSFSVNKQDCIWSTDALSFNGGFSFFSKRTGTGKKMSGNKRLSRYREFFGLMYQDKTWTRYTGPSRTKCQKMCDTASNSEGQTCHGYSYRGRDKTCLLTANGLLYDTNYDYYERTPDKKVGKNRSRKSSMHGNRLQKTFKPKKKPVTLSKEYKQQLVVQEADAKKGAKELVQKGRRKKRRSKAKKKIKAYVSTHLAEKKTMKRKAQKRKKVKKKAGRIKKKKKEMKKEVKTTNMFMIMKQRIREASRKADVAYRKKLRAAKKKHREKLKKELAYKTKKKEIGVKKARQRELTSKKVDVLIFRGVRLAAKERHNKKAWAHFKEDAAKQALAKRQAKVTLARRHARHRAEFKKFVRKTLKRRLKKKKANIVIRQSLVKMMKQRKRVLAKYVKKQRKLTARVHLVALNIAKLKAKANGIQHVINLRAKRGKKSPAENIKLKYTMNAVKSQQRMKAFKTKKMLKCNRSVRNQKAAIKRLDRKMTKAGAGRRRRAIKSNTQAAPKGTGVKAPTNFPSLKKRKTNPLTTRRRRSKARLIARYVNNARMNGGAEAKLQSVPKLPTVRL